MKFARLIGYIVLVGSAVYFLRALLRHADALPAVSFDRRTVAVLAVCLGLYLAQVAAAGLAWHFWLTAAREASRPGLAVALFAISQLAKYLPGGVAQHLARVALGERHHLSTPGMIVTITLEQSWALVAGITVAATSTLLLGSALDGIPLPPTPIVALLVGTALLLPPALLWLGGERRPTFLDRWLGAWRATHPRPRTVALCFVLYAAGIANSGWNIDLIARYALGAPETHPLLAIGVFALAWVTGFITLVSPGGIGIREAVLVAGLAPAYGSGIALAAAMIYRILTSLGDGLAFLIGFVLERRLLAANRKGGGQPV